MVTFHEKANTHHPKYYTYVAVSQLQHNNPYLLSKTTLKTRCMYAPISQLTHYNPYLLYPNLLSIPLSLFNCDSVLDV